MSTTSPPPQLDKQTKLMCEPIECTLLITADSKRYKTDCLCLIVGLLFSITLVTLAVLFFNYGK